MVALVYGEKVFGRCIYCDSEALKVEKPSSKPKYEKFRYLRCSVCSGLSLINKEDIICKSDLNLWI